MTINKNLYSDIVDSETGGAAAAALINDNKRVVNESVDYINTFDNERGTGAVTNVGTASDEIPTNATVDSKISALNLGTAAQADTATNAEVLTGTAGVLPDSEQVRKNHVAHASTIADLRNLEPAFDGQQVELLGHTIAGVGGGMFYADFSSSAADDNGFTVVTGGGKRWVREDTGEISVCDAGAYPGAVAAVNDAALTAATTYLNNRYTEKDGLLRMPPAKGRLVIPENGLYEFSATFELTGNYSFIMLGSVHYVGPAGVTVFKIGRSTPYDNPATLNYVLNASTEASNCIGFELKNLAGCEITTRKIKGFAEGLKCLAVDGFGFFGNKFNLGLFDINVIDIHIRSENNGWPNANRFYDGFFYKDGPSAVMKHCVKFSSDGIYIAHDSNLFDGCNFEEGRANCIPILLQVGETNVFRNLRVEQCYGPALAKIARPGNIIETRGVWSSTTDIISDGVQQTLCTLPENLPLVYDSGSLSSGSYQTPAGRVFSRIATFRDLFSSTYNSAITPPSVNTFERTPGGLKLLSTRSILAFRFRVNQDRRFYLRTITQDTSKKVSIAVSCFNASGERLLLSNPAIESGTWSHDQYIKSGANSPFINNANLPYTGAGAYQFPAPTSGGSISLQTHPDVTEIEIYYLWGGSPTDNDFTLGRVMLFSDKGTAVPAESVTDRDGYEVVSGVVYSRAVAGGSIVLTETA